MHMGWCWFLLCFVNIKWSMKYEIEVCVCVLEVWGQFRTEHKEKLMRAMILKRRDNRPRKSNIQVVT